jgi:putative methyltransferase (TIGR04325 family)
MIHALKKHPLILPIRKMLHEKKFANHKNVHYFRGVFENFEDAIASAPKTKPFGYDNPEAAKMYKERTQRLYSTDYPVLFWMEKIRSEIATVFDFGGHIGVHYYAYLKVLDCSKITNWTVCDVESVCQEGRDYARSRDSHSKLTFVSDIKFCNNYDLFLAKGSLQYLEWNLHDKLVECGHKPKYIIINMTPLHPQTKTITLNNIGTAFCPYHIRKESDFLIGLESIGYQVLDSWDNPEKSCSIAFEQKRSIEYYRGAILKLRDNFSIL